MSEIREAIVFYSKYSSASNYLFERYSDCLSKMKTINVDNETIRRQICESDDLKITHLPSLLLSYQSGVVNLYHGEQLFKWFNGFKTHLEPPRPPKTRIAAPKAVTLLQPELESEEILEESSSSIATSRLQDNKHMLSMMKTQERPPKPKKVNRNESLSQAAERLKRERDVSIKKI